MKISEMTISQRPREKAILYGIDSLSDHELLMLVVRHGNSMKIPVGTKAVPALI